MKTTKMTRKIAALFAAAMIIATVSICASAEAGIKLRTDDTIPTLGTENELHFDGIPRGGKIDMPCGVRV